jgi:hypothetical protein
MLTEFTGIAATALARGLWPAVAADTTLETLLYAGLDRAPGTAVPILAIAYAVVSASAVA